MYVDNGSQPNPSGTSNPAPIGLVHRDPAQPQTMVDVIRTLDAQVRSGDLDKFRPIPTSIAELDASIGGGLKPGQLVLLGGPAGVGKTSLLLQIARNIASGGQASSLFVCYEHETGYLAQRLISMESVNSTDGPANDGLRVRDIADLVLRYARAHPGQGGFMEALATDPRGVRAMQRAARYWQNLLLMKGSSSTTTVGALAGLVREVRTSHAEEKQPLVLFVDYLQKVATHASHTEEVAQSIEAVEELKELALSQEIVVVAIVAADAQGLKAQRLRLQHMLTSTSVAYEADIIILMNEKYDIVDRNHIDYNRHNAEQFHNYVVLSIEKNRAGPDLADLELRKMLQYCLFRPDARRVTERLVTSRPRD